MVREHVQVRSRLFTQRDVQHFDMKQVTTIRRVEEVHVQSDIML